MKPSIKSRRLKTYLAAGVGSTATLSTQAEAAIVYFDVNPDQVFGITSSLNFGGINLNTGAYTLNDTSGTTFGLNFSGYEGALFGDLNPLGNVEWGYSGSYVERLTGAASISGSSLWSWAAAPAAVLLGGYVGADGNWGVSGPGDSNTGYAPLRIDAGGGNYHYGWAEITTEAGNIYSPPYLGTVDVTVTGFAFNTTVNQAIEAGAIPEPSALAYLLLGGSAFAFSRRRRLVKDQRAS